METKEVQAILAKKQHTIMLYRRVCGYLVGIMLLVSCVLLYRHISSDKSSLQGRPLSQEAWLDEASIKYFQLSQQVENAKYCMPLHVDIVNETEIYFHHCPPQVFSERGQEHKIKPDYVVDARIARRFHFWREVYSTWSSDQYVLHSSHYPEVVLETVDVSHLSGNLSSVARKAKADNVIKIRKKAYRNLLIKMHSMYRSQKPFDTPAMLKLEANLQHINDKNKYWNVARSIRTQRGQKDFIASGLQSSGRYLAAIKQEFAKQEVPEDLANIAFIESSFNLQAYSKVGASGIFQIMPATGKQYMIINDYIDERRDPIKSATAAAKLLKLNHRLTKSWPLAITAYNHGVGGINRAVKSVGSNDIVTLIEKYEGNAFGFASKNFYTGFLGLLDTLENAEKIFPNVMKFSELHFNEYRVTKPIAVGQIKKNLNISNDIIMFYNPDLSKSAITENIYLPTGYRLKHPKPDPTPTSVAVNSEKENI